MLKYIDKIVKLHDEISKNVPASREQSSTLTCLQEATRHLIKASEAQESAVGDDNNK